MGGINIIYDALYTPYLNENDHKFISDYTFYAVIIILLIALFLELYIRNDNGEKGFFDVVNIWSILMFFGLKVFINAGFASGIALYNISYI